jgi:hypothetical protein
MGLSEVECGLDFGIACGQGSFSEEFASSCFLCQKQMAFGHAHPVGVHSFGGTNSLPSLWHTRTLILLWISY